MIFIRKLSFVLVVLSLFVIGSASTFAAGPSSGGFSSGGSSRVQLVNTRWKLLYVAPNGAHRKYYLNFKLLEVRYYKSW